MSDKGKRRTWSVEQKRRIVEQSRIPGVSVSQVARRYDVNANLVFRWLRDPRFKDVSAVPSFLPVTIAQSADVVVKERKASSSCPDGRIVVCVAGGHRLEICGSFDGHAVSQLLKGLKP